MAARATAATAFPDPGGTGIRGGGTGKCVKWLLEVAEVGVSVKDEVVTNGLEGAVFLPTTEPLVLVWLERSTGVAERRRCSTGPALFGDLQWNALFLDSTKCL